METSLIRNNLPPVQLRDRTPDTGAAAVSVEPGDTKLSFNKPLRRVQGYLAHEKLPPARTLP